VVRGLGDVRTHRRRSVGGRGSDQAVGRGCRRRDIGEMTRKGSDGEDGSALLVSEGEDLHHRGVLGWARVMWIGSDPV
jgi:hypothetical protein